MCAESFEEALQVLSGKNIKGKWDQTQSNKHFNITDSMCHMYECASPPDFIVEVLTCNGVQYVI